MYRTATESIPPATSLWATTTAEQLQSDIDTNHRASQTIADTLAVVRDHLDPQRRVLRAGDAIYRAGERFGHLFILNSGTAKIEKPANPAR